MAGSTRELAIIALAEGRALHPQHPGHSHPRSPPVLSNFSTGVTLDFFLNGRSVSSSHSVVLASARACVQYLAVN